MEPARFRKSLQHEETGDLDRSHRPEISSLITDGVSTAFPSSCHRPTGDAEQRSVPFIISFVDGDSEATLEGLAKEIAGLTPVAAVHEIVAHIQQHPTIRDDLLTEIEAVGRGDSWWKQVISGLEHARVAPSRNELPNLYPSGFYEIPGDPPGTSRHWNGATAVRARPSGSRQEEPCGLRSAPEISSQHRSSLVVPFNLAPVRVHTFKRPSTSQQH